jgi:hypothetical protein
VFLVLESEAKGNAEDCANECANKGFKDDSGSAVFHLIG